MIIRGTEGAQNIFFGIIMNQESIVREENLPGVQLRNKLALILILFNHISKASTLVKRNSFRRLTALFQDQPAENGKDRR